MNHQTPDNVYWIWLSLCLGPGCRNAGEILDVTACNSMAVYLADLERYREWGVFSKQQIEKLLDKDLSKAERIFDYCMDNHISVINPRSGSYPKTLARIPSCPIVLYALGSLPDFDNMISVSMVGTRKMTSSGKRAAYEISYDLAKSGIIITSGMALGIDGVCHTAALDCGGTTVAVLGCGIDVVYPSQHRELMDNIITFNGAVITEFAPGTRPYGGNFPIRNRIISGLSVGTVIVEAGDRSGALNTANHAFEQGKDVFAVPGPTGEYNSMGSNNLLKKGGLAVTCAGDIIDYYTKRYGSKINFNHIIKLREAEIYKPLTRSTPKPYFRTKTGKEEIKTKEKDSLTPRFTSEVVSQHVEQQQAINKKKGADLLASSDEITKKIYDTISEEAKFPDQIALELNIPISNVLTVITILEVQDLIKRHPGGQYVAK